MGPLNKDTYMCLKAFILVIVPPLQLSKQMLRFISKADDKTLKDLGR